MAKEYIHINYLGTRNKELLPGCCLIKYQTFPLHMQHENRTVSPGREISAVGGGSWGGWGTSEGKVAMVRKVRCEAVENY